MAKTPVWMDTAKSYLGVKEVPGRGNNPVIVDFFRKAHNPDVKTDSTAWCSAFVNACMYENGIKGTDKLNARSWMEWDGGSLVNTPRYGDIVVFWRGSRSSWKGHVAFFVKWNNTHIWVLGGNQGDKVSIRRYQRSRLLGFIRPNPTTHDHKDEATMPKMVIDKSVGRKPKSVVVPSVLGVGGAYAYYQALFSGDRLIGIGVVVALAAFILFIMWKRRFRS